MVSLDETVENAWMRSQARCECRRESQRHGDRCAHDLVWEQRGRATHRGAWEALYRNSRVLAGWEAVKQVEILCWECYQRVAQGGIPTQPNKKESAAPFVGRGGAGSGGMAPRPGARRIG